MERLSCVVTRIARPLTLDADAIAHPPGSRAGLRLLTGRDDEGPTTIIDVEKEAVLTKIEPAQSTPEAGGAEETPGTATAKGAA